MNLESTPRTFMFIGRSGCGKGTQAKLLEEWLAKQTPKRSLFKLETGEKIRAFMAKRDKNYSSKLSAEIYDHGGLQPEFFVIWIWASEFIERLKGDDNIILDGTPRRLNEARVLDSAFKFYSREKPTVIFMNVSRDWAIARLTSRQRVDDSPSDITARLDWYETYVVEALDFYRDNPDYNFLDINGEQTVEEVHKEIIKKLSQ